MVLDSDDIDEELSDESLEIDWLLSELLDIDDIELIELRLEWLLILDSDEIDDSEEILLSDDNDEWELKLDQDDSDDSLESEDNELKEDIVVLDSDDIDDSELSDDILLRLDSDDQLDSDDILLILESELSEL